MRKIIAIVVMAMFVFSSSAFANSANFDEIEYLYSIKSKAAYNKYVKALTAEDKTLLYLDEIPLNKIAMDMSSKGSGRIISILEKYKDKNPELQNAYNAFYIWTMPELQENLQFLENGYAHEFSKEESNYAIFSRDMLRNASDINAVYRLFEETRMRDPKLAARFAKEHNLEKLFAKSDNELTFKNAGIELTNENINFFEGDINSDEPLENEELQSLKGDTNYDAMVPQGVLLEDDGVKHSVEHLKSETQSFIRRNSNN